MTLSIQRAEHRDPPETWRKNAGNAGAKDAYDDVSDYSKAIALDQYSGQATSDAANYDPLTTDSGANITTSKRYGAADICYAIWAKKVLKLRKNPALSTGNPLLRIGSLLSPDYPRVPMRPLHSSCWDRPRLKVGAAERHLRLTWERPESARRILLNSSPTRSIHINYVILSLHFSPEGSSEHAARGFATRRIDPGFTGLL